MEASNEVFSSALMRQRDQVVEDKHRKEKDVLNNKIMRLKKANDETLKDLFDLGNRCDRLARALGFKDLREAEVAIDTADNVPLYKEVLERGEQVEGELDAERAKNDELYEQITVLKQEQERLKADVASAERNLQRAQLDTTRQQAKADRVTAELTQLMSRYDTLSDVRERCAVKYKKDYATWRSLKDWLFDDTGLDGLAAREKKSKLNAQVKEKKQIIKAYHARNDPSEPPPHPPLGDVEFVEEEEAIVEATTPRKRKHSPSPPSSPVVKKEDEAPQVPQPQMTPPSSRRSLFKPGTNEILSSSPTVFNEDSARRNSTSTRRPLNFQPIAKQTPKKWSPSDNVSNGSHPMSSQTQPETPERSSRIRDHVPTSPATSPAPAHMASSQTEPESQSQLFPFPPTFPSKATPRPLTMMNMVPRTVPARIGGAVVARDPETLQPIKMQKLSDHPATSPRRRPPRLPIASNNTSTPSQARKPLGSKENRPFLVPTSTPMNARDNNPKPGDYSAFKGRGRYAKEVAGGKNTINAQYMIDPAQNGGVQHQFDEVVRNKRERQQMDAGDCECCRDYYEAVGPLPSRMKAPLWRSPKKNKPLTHSATCKHHGSKAELQDLSTEDNDILDGIGAHQKAVSRHRHHWARTNTPPGYWEIGFPDTQETEDINERAREMHEKKRQEVDAAARREGGRYRRRD